MKTLSIIVPVRNEEKNINRLCEIVNSEMMNAHIDYELIIVDDHSTDKTKSEVNKLISKYPLRFFTKQGKRGKGYSILEGAAYAQAPLVCMLDADLQYSPKHISEMVNILNKNPEAGVVVAQRKEYRGKLFRKIASKLNAFVVGTLLFGLNVDIQSGLKVFRKEIVEHIDIKTVGPWSVDIPLLHIARELGFTIKQVPIVFENRDGGESKVRFLSTTTEIVWNALKLRMAPQRIFEVKPHTNESMIGAGLIHKRKRYITHTTLAHHNSAIQTLHTWQRNALIGFIVILVIGFFINITASIVTLFALLNAMYFTDVFFNLYMTVKTLYKDTEITSSQEEIDSLQDKDLPIYTVLCPLYKEANIIPQFVQAMSQLDWPKDKLDVMLLLEEDDQESIQAAKDLHLPSFVRVVVVPHSFPKTKPKATNYGLAHSNGEYVVIYDAEDIPDNYQLKKAYLGFKKSPAHIVCLQAKLNYYNPHQNLLTRFFTAEYSLWFDLILPGLQSIEAPLPLGGTSNHFRKSMLTELEGWDSFNVTEDCDLGIRLAKYGYQTAIIDSVTMEEANSNLRNWINQRSRWIKGYIQSYLVHMRFPRTFARENTRDFFLFQLVVGGKILALFINPIMWLLTILYFTSRAHYGIYIEKLFPGPLLYMAGISLVVGNFVYLYYYMIACAKRDHYGLIKYVYLVPFYWLAMSYAGYKALSELFYKPHFWQKTVHGLHLAKAAQHPKKTSYTPSLFPQFSVPQFNPHHRTGILLVASIGIAGFINFLFNAYLGRVLSFEDFALVSLIGGLLALTTIISSAFNTTLNYKTSFLVGRYGEEAAYSFWRQIRKYAFYVSLGITLLWIAALPLIHRFFRTTDIYPIMFFAPILLVNLVAAADRGYLGGRLMFGSQSILIVIEPLVKFLAAVGIILLGYKSLSYNAMPISIIGVFLVGWFLAFYKNSVSPDALKTTRVGKTFPWKFYAMTVISGFSLVFFMNVDVLLAKHYLPSAEAGEYALLMLVGKIIFFFGGLVSPFIIPLVSRNEGQNKSSHKILAYTLASTAILVSIGVIVLGGLGHITVPFLFGEKTLLITPYLILVTTSLGLFTLSKVFIDYYLVKKNFLFTIGALALSGLELALVLEFHNSLEQFVYVMSGIWSLHLLLTLALHFNIGTVEYYEKAILEIFRNRKQSDQKADDIEKDKLSILIFNWRDTKHKWAGGAEVYVHELAKRWVEDGNRVTLFCGSGKSGGTHEYVDGVEVYRRGKFISVYVWAFIYYMFLFRGKYDVIIDCENGIPFYTPLFAREKKFLLIHHVHQEVFRKSLPWILAELALFLEAKVMPFVYRNTPVITVSPSSKAEIMKHKLSSLEPAIIYNGVDITTFKPGQKNSRPMIMYLGRLQYYKSLHVFIKAAKKVLETIPDVEFVIAGEGEEKKKLERYAAKSGISDNIRFLGKVSDEEKINLFQKAWAFVNPSFMEGWGITTIEANACGTPAIASNVPGLRDSVKNPHTGYLVTYGDHDAFASRIVELIQNTKLRNEMSEESIRWAHKFTWEKSAQELYRLMSTYALS